MQIYLYRIVTSNQMQDSYASAGFLLHNLIKETKHNFRDNFIEEHLSFAARALIGLRPTI